MAKIVCFGEILLRMTAPGRELLLQSRQLDVHVGGAEANVAVGLACLGHDVSMVSVVPDNALARAACGELRRYGVKTDAIVRAPGRMGLYFLASGAGLRASEIVYDRAHSAFADAAPTLLEWAPLLEGASLLHVSGITPALGPAAAAAASRAIEAARAARVPISFDVNHRAKLWESSGSDPRAVLPKLMAAAAILFANHRDMSLLLGQSFSGEGDQRRRAAATAAFTAFPQLELLASTARQVNNADEHRIMARLDDRNDFWQTEEVAVSGIVDRIGAGDAFAAGVLHGRLSGRDTMTATRFGLALTCLKHSLPGDVSLFNQGDIDAFLAGDIDVRR